MSSAVDFTIQELVAVDGSRNFIWNIIEEHSLGFLHKIPSQERNRL